MMTAAPLSTSSRGVRNPQAAPTAIMPAAVAVRMSTSESPTYATRAGGSPKRAAIASATAGSGLSGASCSGARDLHEVARVEQGRDDGLGRRVRLVGVDGERDSVRSQLPHQLGDAVVDARLDQ